MDVSTDPQLLARWREGDEEAGNELFTRYFDAVYRFFCNKVSEGIEDLVQDAFLACVDGRDRLRDDQAFRGYLFTSARRILWRHCERRAKRAERFDSATQSVADLDPSPSAVVSGRLEQRLLLEALRRVPLDHQVVLEMYYWEDMSGPELAQILDIPEATVRSRLRRGLERLRKALAELSGTEHRLHETQTDFEAWARSLRELVTPKAG
jgi:RNA polymerase sigma factor (sigma-70 family)